MRPLLRDSLSHVSQQPSRLLLRAAVYWEARVHGQSLFERLFAFFLLANRLVDLGQLDRGR